MVNHFSIMLQRRLREDNGEDEEDEGEKSGKKKKKGGGKGGDLRIHDLEDELEMSSDESDCSVGEGKFAPPPSPLSHPHLRLLNLAMSCGGTTKVFLFHTDGENKTKPKKAPAKGKGKKKKRKDDEDALEDSDDGDYEGLEVDYMSDESR